jgi:choline monooxygenase
MIPFDIDPDIRRAETLPARVYRDGAYFDAQRRRVFRRAWHLVTEADPGLPNGHAAPLTLLPGCLDEPLVLVRDEEGVLRCLSNVCTHRGNLVVAERGAVRQLRCSYHGRRFELSGCFRSMPEFEEALGFPTPHDDLAAISLAPWPPLVFLGLEPRLPIETYLRPVIDRMGWLPLERFAFTPESSTDYEVEANWALYCDNYLEGFHIPFVHGALNEVLDYGSYRTELFEHGSVQIGVASRSEDAFELPPGHPDAGQAIAAYYYWLFPNLMLNFYPWGLSVNIVEPLGPSRTRVRFRSYVLDPEKRVRGAGGDLHRVEMEDEAVVQAVQRGVRGSLYDRGRYSPSREQGVHHFHRLLAEALSGA